MTVGCGLVTVVTLIGAISPNTAWQGHERLFYTALLAGIATFTSALVELGH
jgi:hypothetical protein